MAEEDLRLENEGLRGLIKRANGNRLTAERRINDTINDLNESRTTDISTNDTIRALEEIKTLIAPINLDGEGTNEVRETVANPPINIDNTTASTSEPNTATA